MSFSCKKGKFDLCFNRLDRSVENLDPTGNPTYGSTRPMQVDQTGFHLCPGSQHILSFYMVYMVFLFGPLFLSKILVTDLIEMLILIKLQAEVSEWNFHLLDFFNGDLRTMFYATGRVCDFGKKLTIFNAI